jgi:hypothetical protein
MDAEYITEESSRQIGKVVDRANSQQLQGALMPQKYWVSALTH